MRLLRLLYAVIAFLLFTSALLLGVVLLLSPELWDRYGAVVWIVIGAAVVLLAAELIALRIGRGR